jgi:hypothetical protein
MLTLYFSGLLVALIIYSKTSKEKMYERLAPI